MRKCRAIAPGLLALVLAPRLFGQAPKPPDLATATVVDLTHAFDDKTIYWPTSPSAFELKSLAYGPTPGGWFYSSNSFCTPEHGGTHLDAPIHWVTGKDGADVGSIAPSQLIGPACVVDKTFETDTDNGYLLTVADLEAWEGEHGRVPDGAFGQVDRKRFEQILAKRIEGPGGLADFLRQRQGIPFCGPLLLGEGLTPVGACQRSANHDPSPIWSG